MPNSDVTINPYDFNTSIYSIDRLILGGVESNYALLIPEFQREYTWEDEDIERLFSDLLLGFSSSIKEKSGHFFGATVWNKRNRTDLEPDFTISSYDIVDGQQRITTCLLLLISLMIIIRKNQKEIDEENAINPKLEKWLKTEYSSVRQNIYEMINGDMRWADLPYPRLIQEEDIRAKKKKTKNMNHQLPKFLWKLGKLLIKTMKLNLMKLL